MLRRNPLVEEFRLGTFGEGEDVYKRQEQNVSYAISLVKEGNETPIDEIGGDCICITAKGKPIKPKTLGQKEYIKSIRENSITVGVGPAGTGKTYLAVAMAVTALRNKQVSRIAVSYTHLRGSRSSCDLSFPCKCVEKTKEQR